jgi:lipopolysaccharide transport system ATP-binding protein
MSFQDKCLARMRQAADDEGKTILYVSHNMETIRRLCERCIVMDQGKILQRGRHEELIEQEGMYRELMKSE